MKIKYNEISRNEKCPCGSDKKYKTCCLNKADTRENLISKNLSPQSNLDNYLKSSFIKNCIYHDQSKCSEKIIKAHSIQNNKILSSLSVNGEVVVLRLNAELESLNFKGQEIGKKIATIFSGFCSYHDKTVFQPIEDIDYINNEEQNFLFAYRTFAYEYHKKLEQINAFRILVRNIPSILKNKKMVSYYRSLQASGNDTNFFKTFFDNAIINKDYKGISTLLLKFNGNANIAVCSGFFLEYDLNGNILNDVQSLNPERLKLLMLYIFPQNNDTFIIFNYLTEDTEFYNSFLTSTRNFKEELQVRLLNVILHPKCTRPVAAPLYHPKL